ncbi:hypothetical protein ACQB60_32305 [Actinomycetota bacterium Odt1-20B]
MHTTHVRRHAPAALGAVLAAVLAGALGSAPAAHADDEGDFAAVVHKELCSDQERGPLWYSAVDSWQSLQPYHWKKNVSPEAETRAALYQDRRLTEDVRVQMCADMTTYAGELKKHVLDLKGDLKTGCATATGMNRFYDHKRDLFHLIEERDWKALDSAMPGWRKPAFFASKSNAWDARCPA